MTNDIFARDPERPSTRPSFTRKAAWGRPPGSGLASHTWRGSLLQAVTLSVHPALLVGHHTEGVGTSALRPGLTWRLGLPSISIAPLSVHPALVRSQACRVSLGLSSSPSLSRSSLFCCLDLRSSLSRAGSPQPSVHTTSGPAGLPCFSAVSVLYCLVRCTEP